MYSGKEHAYSKNKRQVTFRIIDIKKKVGNNHIYHSPQKKVKANEEEIRKYNQFGRIKSADYPMCKFLCMMKVDNNR